MKGKCSDFIKKQCYVRDFVQYPHFKIDKNEDVV